LFFEIAKHCWRVDPVPRAFEARSKAIGPEWPAANAPRPARALAKVRHRRVWRGSSRSPTISAIRPRHSPSRASADGYRKSDPGTRPPPRRSAKLARRPGAVRIPALALACHHRKPGDGGRSTILSRVNERSGHFSIQCRKVNICRFPPPQCGFIKPFGPKPELPCTL
jgi:hypothetical protein